jgi:hypothetical protein
MYPLTPSTRGHNTLLYKKISFFESHSLTTNWLIGKSFERQMWSNKYFETLLVPTKQKALSHCYKEISVNILHGIDVCSENHVKHINTVVLKRVVPVETTGLSRFKGITGQIRRCRLTSVSNVFACLCYARFENTVVLTDGQVF